MTRPTRPFLPVAARVTRSLALLLLFLGFGAWCAAAGPVDPGSYTPTYRLVFYAVLEGCFEDGLTNADVDQILLREKPGARYDHFIYACPICTPTIHALETYRQRPEPYSTKVPGDRTFGPGLPPDLHAWLYSADVKLRLAAIHDLEEAWVKRRVESLRLTPEELAKTEKGLQDGREKGIRMMQSFVGPRAMYMTSAYKDGGECAVCNAAVGMKLKLADDKPAAAPATP